MTNADDVLKLLEQRHGVSLKKSFYNSWYDSQSYSASAPPHLERLYTGVFNHFLNLDISACTEPYLRRKGIQQKMVLQLQHTIDTSSSLYYLTDALDQNGPISRGNLKWIMTDGDCDIIVFELNKIPSMNLKTPFGSKVQITSALYASGILLVKPENFELLGGRVPELYGDTMENELLRRYRKQLQLQSNPEADRTTPRPTATPASALAHQNNTRPFHASTTTTSNWATINNDTRLTSQAIPNVSLQQATSSRGINERTNDDDFDDEFDYWPTDDLNDLEELEQQATNSYAVRSIDAATNATNATNTTRNLHSRGSSNLDAFDDEFSQRRTSVGFTDPPTDTSTPSAPKRRPALSLSTKSKPKANNTQPVTAQPSSTAYIDLDTPSPPLRPSTNPHIQQSAISEIDDMMTDDLQWLDDDTLDNGDAVDKEKPPRRILDVSGLRTLLDSLDGNSFTGNDDRVVVQIQGCVLLKMKAIDNVGLHLTVKLAEDLGILVNFIYAGIDSLIEGYTVNAVFRMKKELGINAVKEKVYSPLKSRLADIQALLEIDLTLTEIYENVMVRKGIKFTPI